MNQAILILGSNIDARTNLRRGLTLLRECATVLQLSSTWETAPIEANGSNFLNLAADIETQHDPETLKWQVLRQIEQRLGRVRQSDKNAPRTVDMDIVIFNGEVLDKNLWSRAYMALPVAEFLPTLPHPLTGTPLAQVAAMLQQSTHAILTDAIEGK